MTKKTKKIPVQKGKNKYKDKDKNKKTVNLLTDIDTESVHLVHQGANGMTFSVVKSATKTGNVGTEESIQTVAELALELSDADEKSRQEVAMKIFDSLAPIAGVEIVKDDSESASPQNSHWMTQMRELMGTISETLSVLRDTKEKSNPATDDPEYVKVLFKTAGMDMQKISDVIALSENLQDRIDKIDTALIQVGELAGLVKDATMKIGGFAKRLRNLESTADGFISTVNENETNSKGNDVDWSGDLAEIAGRGE